MKKKMEVEVKSKDTVKSHVGRGFGITIGVILALFVVMLIGFGGCSTLFGLGANEISKHNYSDLTSDDTGSMYDEIVKDSEKITQPLQENLNEIVGKEPQKEEKIFSENSIVNSQKGISVSIDDFEIEKISDTFAKITKIKLTILNNGTNMIFPEVGVMLWDEDDDPAVAYKFQETIKMDGGIDEGNYKQIEAHVNIGFNDIHLTKNLKLGVYEVFSYPSKLYVSVEKEFVVE